MQDAGDAVYPAPLTPQAPDVPVIVPPSPGSENSDIELAIAAGASTKASSAELVAQDQQEWDPNFGNEAAPSSPTPVQTSGTQANTLASIEQEGNTWQKMMNDEDTEMGETEASGAATDTELAVPEQVEEIEYDDWLALGVCVLYTDDDSDTPKEGWVFKVTPDDDEGAPFLWFLLVGSPELEWYHGLT